MHLRRSFALTAGVALLTAGLSSCGFDYATDQPYTPAAGTNNKEAEVDVMSAVVVAAQDDSGTFIASFTNPTADEIAVSEIAGIGDTQVQVEEFEPVEVAPTTLVDLSDDGGVPLSGDFGQGDMLTFEVAFDDGSAVTMRVPVVRACGVWEGLDVTAEEHGTEAAAASEDAHDEYSCDQPEGSAGH